MAKAVNNQILQSRFPDYGPCDITNWKEFLLKSRKKFQDCWNSKKAVSQRETLSDFKQITFLGSGSFGDVVLVQHRVKGNYFAMKSMEKEKIIKLRQLEHLKNEKNVLKCIDFPFTVYLVNCFKDNSYIYLVMPFIQGGELFNHLRNCGKFDEAQAKFFASQVILAIEYLHYLDLVYRDLKPENILVDHTGYLKLTDFGFCKLMKRSRTYTLCGTPEYLAPEVVLSKGYGKAVDWWAIGVLMYEMVAGGSPFCAQNDIKIYENIIGVNYKMPWFFSEELKDLVKKILQADVTRRYGNLKNGAEDIKGHYWFRPINWMAILNRKLSTPWKPKINNAGDTQNFDKGDWKPPVIAKTNLYSTEFEDF